MGAEAGRHVGARAPRRRDPRGGAALKEATAPVRLRPIVLLASAAFCSSAALRIADPLIPQVADEFGVSVGAAAGIASAFTLSYGLFQIFYGPLGDRLGKFAVAAVATLVAALLVTAGTLAGSLETLWLLRFCSGAAAGAVIPLAIAYIGDVVPYQQRQAVLGRFISGQISGIIVGQALGGILGEYAGWRGVFLALGSVYVAISALLLANLGSAEKPTRPPLRRGVLASYAAVALLPRVRLLCAIVFVEGFVFWGGFTYVGAYLRAGWRLDYLWIGVVLAGFGVGGLVYSLTVNIFIRRLGQRGMVLGGGILLAAAFAAVTAVPHPGFVALLTMLCGLGFYMLHNTLQVHATQMAPEARGLALSIFAACLFLGQAAGVALCGRLVDAIGFGPVLVVTGLGVLGAALWFAAAIRSEG